MKRSKKLPLPLRLIRWAFPKLERLAPELATKWAWRLFFTPIRFKAPKKEVEAALKAHQFEFEGGQQTIQGYEWGSGEKVVLLLHGWAGRGPQLHHFIEPLNELGFKVVAIDGPAHGKSSGKSTHILHYADAILQLEKLYPNVEAIISHSFGGAASIQAIRLGLNINKLITIGTPTIGDYIISDFLRRINGSPRSGERFKQNIVKQFNRTFDEFSVMNSIEQVKGKMDMLMIHDRDDREVPIHHAQDLQSKAPWVQLHITEGLGHMRILKDKSVIEECCAFVKEKKLEFA